MRTLHLLSLFILFETSGNVFCSSTPAALQIIETRDGPNGTKVLHYKGGSVMRDILTADDVKDLPILVYSVTGKTRGGKSFLLNLMYKYLDAEGKTNWTQGLMPNVFDFKDGVDSMTKGLWVCTKIFRKTLQDGSQVGIMLMDNQGLFDGDVTGGESVAMSGVSTILSHVQMFNIKEKITTNDAEQVMLHFVPENVKNKTYYISNMGSSLMFLVRDFTGGKKYGFGFGNGKKYIEQEQARGTQEYRAMWTDQISVFNKLDCVLLPHPGLHVMTEEFTQSPNLQNLQSNFVSEVNSFLTELFALQNLIPRTLGLTGLRIHETLTNIDGKAADNSLSYYNMYVDRTNRIITDTAVKSFTNKLESSRDMYKAKGYIEEAVIATKFMGQSANKFTSELRLEMERIVNLNVVKHLINTYKDGTNGGDIKQSHGNVWPKADFGLLVGPPSEVKGATDDIVKEMATVYYGKLVQEESNTFKAFCETAKSIDFYHKMLSLRNNDEKNAFLESCIRPMLDFERTGASLAMLNDIRNNQKNQFGANVQTSILRNMYRVKEYFVDRYRNHLNRDNVNAVNSGLWPDIKRDIDSLTFETDNERRECTQSIYMEIANIFYRTFREEVYRQIEYDVWSLGHKAFCNKYEPYTDEGRMKAMVAERFPEYDQFRYLGLTNIWVDEKNVLDNYVKLLIHKNLQERRNKCHDEYKPSRWVRFRDRLFG